MFPELFVRIAPTGTCWICRSSIKLSREHKFKASDLRRQFGSGPLHIGHFEDLSSGRIAQGVNSDRLKFKNSICERCNSSVTQDSDRAYDQFILQMERSSADAEEFYQVFSDARFCKGRGLHVYLPLFRYFAKQLGCQLADIGAPIPLHLSKFVAKRTNRNCIWLKVNPDKAYENLSSDLAGEELKYAAHGGLVVITKAPTFLPSRLYTTLSIGQIQFIFFFVLTSLQILEMRLRYPSFVKWCAQTARTTISNPIPSSTLQRLGL